MRKSFLDNEREMLEFYIDNEIFHPERTFMHLLKSPSHQVRKDFINSGMELIIRPECNQKCEYCYVARYGDALYPHAERINNEQILKNIDILLDYIFNTKGIYIEHWELFAGDMFYDNLFFDVLDVFYKHLDRLYEKYAPVFVFNEGLILTPTNFSFITDDDKCKRVNEYIEKFRKFNWDIGFSVSTDGKYAVDTREKRPLDDAYFDKLFQWTQDHPRNGFHPIVAASNVKNAIQNYEWWRDMFDKWYGPNDPRGFLPYFLEARNDEWTTENIQDYNRLLDFMVEDRLRMCNNDIDHLAYHLFRGDGLNGTLKGIEFSDMIDVRVPETADKQERANCSLSSLFVVNMADLSLVPCHRLTYHQFRGGNFIVENDKIVGLQAKNATGFLNIIMLPGDALPKCANCIYTTICHRGCFGAQFEASGEVFLPALSVCELMKASRYFLIRKYWDMGVLESAKRQGLLIPEAEGVYRAILADGEGMEVYMP